MADAMQGAAGSTVAWRRDRAWLPTIAVASVIVLLVFGGFVVAAALSEPAGPPVTVGRAVTVQPLTGWEALAPGETGGLPADRITRGGGNLDVVVAPFYANGARSLANEYADRVLRSQLSSLSVSGDLTTVSLGQALLGERFTYVGVTDTGASVEGEVTVTVTQSGAGVVFDGWAPEGLLSFVDGDIHTMIDRARYP
jgi:hypothetical protein